MTLPSAFASGVVFESFAYPTDSVWRFGRDLRQSTNKGKVVLAHPKYTVMNLYRTRISPKSVIRKALGYFTLVATNLSPCKAYAIVLRFFADVSSELRQDNAMHSHTHGSNRNLIALHVILNGRRDCAFWPWKLQDLLYGIQKHA